MAQAIHWNGARVELCRPAIHAVRNPLDTRTVIGCREGKRHPIRGVVQLRNWLDAVFSNNQLSCGFRVSRQVNGIVGVCVDAIGCDWQLQIIRFVSVWCIGVDRNHKIADTKPDRVILCRQLY